MKTILIVDDEPVAPPLTFGLMVVFCATAGPIPTTSAASEATAIET